MKSLVRCGITTAPKTRHTRRRRIRERSFTGEDEVAPPISAQKRRIITRTGDEQRGIVSQRHSSLSSSPFPPVVSRRHLYGKLKRYLGQYRQALGAIIFRHQEMTEGRPQFRSKGRASTWVLLQIDPRSSRLKSWQWIVTRFLAGERCVSRGESRNQMGGRRLAYLSKARGIWKQRGRRDDCAPFRNHGCHREDAVR